jgi:hypothetical protein
LKLRHVGAAAGAFGEWLFSFITVFAGGIALQNVGWKIWLWMALSCATAVPFVYFLCPEVCPFITRRLHREYTNSVLIQTAGKTLEEIDLIFAKDSVKNSDLAIEVLAHHDVAEKSNVTMIEKV